MSQQVLYTTVIHYKILKSHDIEYLWNCSIFLSFFGIYILWFFDYFYTKCSTVQGFIHLSMIKSILINKYGRLFFPHRGNWGLTITGVIEDFGSPKAGSDSEVVTQASVESLPCKLTQILSQELHVISSLGMLVCMLINNKAKKKMWVSGFLL
jgi:hypothetical protein